MTKKQSIQEHRKNDAVKSGENVFVLMARCEVLQAELQKIIKEQEKRWRL